MKKNEKKLFSRQKVKGKRKWTKLFPMAQLLFLSLLLLYFDSQTRPPLVSRSSVPDIRYLSTIKANPNFGLTPTILDLYTTMSKMEKVAQFHVYQSPPWTFTIAQKKRTPLYIISQEKSEFLMTDGSVCRVSASTPLRQFSTIAGLNPHKPLSKKNPCTPANAKAKQIISDTLLISHLLQGDSVIIPTFTYNQEQGYSIAIEPSNSLVHIGFPPFQKKIGRLHQILKKNKNKSLQIDLDFENKAFIKEVDTPI